MSNKTELKNGDKCHVSNVSEEDALSRPNTETYNYIGHTIIGDHIIETPDGHTFSCKYVTPIPEPELVPWTYDTCPLPPFTVKRKGSNNFIVVMSLSDNGCLMGPNINVVRDWVHEDFKRLLNHYEYFPNKQDRNNVWPCGVVK